MIILHQSKPAFWLPSISPYSIKFELFLKAANINYTVSTVASGAPKGKTPYIEYNGEKIGDSSLILYKLIDDFNVRLDDHLDSKPKAIGAMICKALEEGYYFCSLYTEWKILKNWCAFRDNFLSEVPKAIRVPVAGFFRRRLVRSLHYQGMGRHNEKEVESIGLGYLRDLDTLMDDNDYLLGNKFSTYDCTVYGFLSRLLRVPLHHPLREFSHSRSAFKNYCQRIETIYKIATPLGKGPKNPLAMANNTLLNTELYTQMKDRINQ